MKETRNETSTVHEAICSKNGVLVSLVGNEMARGASSVCAYQPNPSRISLQHAA